MALAGEKQLRLSLERPYKHESGKPLHDLLDITPEGIHVPDRPRDPDDLLAENIRRIFIERGTDFFDKYPKLDSLTHALDRDSNADGANASDNDGNEDDASEQPADVQAAMTTDELMQMRLNILQDLFIAQGELSLARDLLSVLLGSPDVSHLPTVPNAHPVAQPVTALPAHSIAAAVVTQPEPIPSVRAFNAQLVLGGKDESLRAAAAVLRSAATALDASQPARERYWLDALKLRRANWALIPAPPPLGAAPGPRGAERLATDFLVSFGLEESPPAFRRRAVAQLPTATTSADDATLVFAHTARTRLRVSLVRDGLAVHDSSGIDIDDAPDRLAGALHSAQRALVEHELFATLVREAGAIPGVSARVSEQLIALEAAPGTELRLELVSRAPGDVSSILPPATAVASAADIARCDLIRAALHLLLLRAHAHAKVRRLADRAPGVPPPHHAAAPPSILQPVLDTLQYEAFCGRVRAEVQRTAEALSAAGVRARVRFAPAGDTGAALLRLVAEEHAPRLAGEAVLRIDGRHTVRLTLLAPSTLTAHLPHATLQLTSITQLTRLLEDEAERALLCRVRDLGAKRAETVGATWFLDEIAGRMIGRWDGGILSFQVTVKAPVLKCTATHMQRDGREVERTYEASPSTTTSLKLFDWVASETDAALMVDVPMKAAAPLSGTQLM